MIVSCFTAASGADLYWNGDTSGGGNGSSDLWDTSSSNWNPNSDYSGTPAIWVNGDNGNFDGTPGTITLGETALAAGTVTFGVAGFEINSNGNNAAWATLAGTGGFTKSGTGTLVLTNSSTASGSITISGGTVSLGDSSALGTSTVTLNGGTLERNAAGATVTNNIAIGAGGGILLGRQVIDDYTLLSGQLTGSAAFTIQGLVRINNTANTYAGPVTISNTSATYFRLSASEVLGSSTDVTLAGANSRMRLDGGVTQTIDSLSGTAGEIFVSKNGAITAARLITGSQNSDSTYAGSFANNDGALTLEKSGTGTQTLNRGGGNAQAITGVIVTNGTLTLNGASVAFNSGYFTGATPITVKPGATLNINNTWNIGSANVITVNAGTMAFNTATDGPNYMNNLTLQNGGTVNGPWRTGNALATSITSSGDSTNTIAGNVFLVKSGLTVCSATVADGAAEFDLNITGRVVDLGDLGSTPGLQGTVLKKSGGGNLRLAGQNLWDGGLLVSEGTVTGSNNAAFGDGPTTLGDAGTGAGNLALLLNGVYAVGTNITVSALGTGTVTIGTTGFSTSANTNFGGALALNRDVILQAGSSDRTTISGLISGTGNITITSPFANDRRIVLDRTAAPANSFAGDITISNNARLQIGVGNNLGNRTVPDTATIRFSNATSALRPAPTGSGDSETIGTLVSLAAGSGIVDMFTGTAFTLSIGGDDETGDFSGVITDTTGALTIEKTGTGTQTLSGANTYSGDTKASAGTLSIGQSYLANAADVRITTGATLNLTHTDTDQIDELYLNNVAQPPGIYGSLSSDATYKVSYITGTGKLLVTTGPANYAAWAAQYAGGQTSNLDFDNDGIANGIEYFMGESDTPVFTANPSVSGGAVTWPRDPDAVVASFTVQVSDNLADWSDIPEGDPNITITSTSVSYTLQTGSAPEFVRLKVVE